ncbi:hypothetical protein [uncultured Cohaesibacter sp.]|uniref:hypothetical protein n=1 Tax=uncultured Cohaesibacter sp. TaxID=1002546 RepID=UPI002AA72AC9|nr:hypothetical protein [uncultured Cohaesibacter sp.]
MQQAEQSEKQAAELAELKHQQAEEEAKRLAEEAERQAEQDAKERADREAEEAKAEQERARKAEAERKQQEEAKRRDDEAHHDKVISDAVAAITTQTGIPTIQAAAVVQLIEAGQVPNHHPSFLIPLPRPGNNHQTSTKGNGNTATPAGGLYPERPMFTETEARQKQCPFVAGKQCVASSCMAWQWAGRKTIERSIRKDTEEGQGFEPGALWHRQPPFWSL